MKQIYNSICQIKIFILSLFVFLASTLCGQTVQELRDNYSGSTSWDAISGTLTFTSTGTINITGKSHNTWVVPNTVKKLVINANVIVTGRFDTSSKIAIEGMDKTTSKIFGTSTLSYAKTYNGGDADALSAIRATAGDITINNLTSLNSKGYAFTHRGGGFMTITNCKVYDTRGGHQNNSDGVVTWGGGLVKDCYFSTGDDNIKVYGDITVENTEIVMIDNAVPIQLGWGSYGNNAKGTFKNITISGTSGRGAEGNAVISARAGTYNKTINIDGIKVNNENASLVNFTAGGTYNITILNADISVGKFYTTWNDNTTATIKICGSSYNKSSTQTKFTCGGSTTDTQAPTTPSGLTSSSVTQSSLTLSWTASTDNIKVTGYDVYQGTTLKASVTTNSASITGLSCNTSYSFTVKAKDAAGNKSAASAAKSVTTSACTANTTTHFEAESYSSMSRITKETTTDTGGGSNIASIHNNDYADYSFNVAKSGTYTTKFRVSSASNGGTIQVLKGTTVLGSVNVAVTGGWQTWTTVTGPSINLTSTGTQTIRLKFVNTNTTGYLMNLNWWECAGSSAVKVARMEPEEIETPSLNISLSPNPAKDFVNLTLNTEGATILLYSTDYKLLKKIISTSNVNQINVSDLISGIYLVKVISADKTKTFKFIKN